ncbi:cell division protein GTP binding protein [Lipomyces oligophaga]|uniref:cell division protein GTP binding protein n=1 Tax=Lipomyces oligophaga TaxID=45792 RepID=UPI0034CE3D71
MATAIATSGSVSTVSSAVSASTSPASSPLAAAQSVPSPVNLLADTSAPTIASPVVAMPKDSSIIRRKITSLVGFSNLPAQYHRHSIQRGFAFNVMVVGASGLGKSTLISTLFNMPLAPEHGAEAARSPSSDPPRTVAIQSMSADLEEGGVRLRLTVVDTPGFGDLVNNDEAWVPIIDTVDMRFDAFLDGENKMSRRSIPDNRIHACIYFIAPTGHSLQALDIDVMKKLHTKVNLIPVIAKSDILTDDEIIAFKSRILADLEHHKIDFFQTPRYELDSETSMEDKEAIMSKIPFAVVGATEEVTTIDGRKVRGRKYPWGTVEVDNENHCDFLKLRSMLVKTYMEELKERTDEVLYENYRTNKLISMGISQDSTVFKEINPLSKLQEERSLHTAKLQKMEAEMKLVFKQKVAEKEQKLKQSEEELFARHREMKEQLEKQRREVEAKLQTAENKPMYSEEKLKKKGFSLRS